MSNKNEARSIILIEDIHLKYTYMYYEPVWNERFVFNIHPEEDTIHFDVYDADVGDKDLIGTGKVKLTNVFDDGKFDDWVKLPAHLGLPVHEEIHVTMNFIPA
ncbi:unnamed protein product [Rotaria socialis]